MSTRRLPRTDEILDAFEGPIEPVRAPLLYRLATFVVAVAMILLPLIYVGIILAVVYLLYLHVLNLPSTVGVTESFKLWLFIALTPLILGGVLLLFMIKPLFAPRSKESAPFELDADDEPKLFAFVHKICDVVGAPRPRKIYVDCRVNAAAGFRRGWLSLLSNDLVLVVGLPLVAGLDTRQFAGVLAHEFGHFAQGAGMRVSYVIRGINRWFARVVYERDQYDRKLEEWAHDSGFQAGIVLHLSRFLVWGTRRILWALMTLGHGISCFLMRQMEFDADRYETRISGSVVFESTLMRLQLLNLALQETHELMSFAWEEGRAAENQPRLVEDRASRIPPEVEESVREQIREMETGWFETHPADRERAENSRSEAAPGVFGLQLPAAAMFEDFDSVSKHATALLYQESLGEEYDRESVVPNARLIDQEAAAQACQDSLGQFFPAGLLNTYPPWPAVSVEPAAGFESEIQRLQRGRDELASAVPMARQVFEEIAKDDMTAELPAASRQVTDRYLQAGNARLAAALRLVRHPKVAERLGKIEERVVEIDRLTAALASMEKGSAEASLLRKNYWSMTELVQSQEEISEGEAQLLLGDLWTGLHNLRNALEGDYPFDSRDGLSIAHHVVGELVASRYDPEEVYEQALGTLQRYDALTFRILASLTWIAKNVEQALGLGPLPEA